MNGNRAIDSAAKRRTKLLFLCPKGSLDSGGVISNFQLIQYLVGQGYDVRVITSWKGDYNDTLSSLSISNLTVDYNWWMPRDTPENISERAINAIAKIVGEIEKFKPDAVITNTSHIPWGALAASMTNTPHIWTVREYPIKNFDYLRDRVEFIKRYSNLIMTNSQELANYYRDEYGCSANHFLSYVDVDNIRFGDKTKTVQLVSPNYMSEGKNQIELIQAAGILRLRRKDLNFRILLMGEKEKNYWPKLKASLEEYGVSDIVDIHDRVSEPWSMVSEQDILIQTSQSESIGRTTTEAMKLGVAVIASDIPGHREAFRLGGGTLYKLKDPHDLADKIEHILDHPTETRVKSRKARQRALRNMSSEASNGPFALALEKVIGQDNPVGANKQIWPYLEYYIRDTNRKTRKLMKDLEKKNADTDLLITALEDVRNSRSYRLGRMQTNLIREVKSLVRKARK